MLTTTETTTTAHLRARWGELLPEVESLARQATALKNAVKYLSSENGYEALKKVEGHLDKLKQLEFPAPDALVYRASEGACDVRRWLDHEWGRKADVFFDQLCQAFREREVAVEGQAPTCQAGPIEVRIEAQEDRADLLYAGEKVGHVPLALDPIFKAWQSVSGQLERDLTPPEALLSQLVAAYDEETKLKGIRRVRLPDLHFRLFFHRQTHKARQNPSKKAVHEYPRFQFAYDLGFLLERQASPELEVQWEGRRLQFRRASESAAGSRAKSLRVELAEGPVALSDLEIGDLENAD